MSNRLDNTRVVTFKEDYKIKGRTTPLYSKGSEYAIHHKTVEKLKSLGAKFDSKIFDEKGAVVKAKEAFLKQKQKELKEE